VPPYLSAFTFKSSQLFAQPWRTALFVIFVFSIFHLLTIGQAELTNDEAQYALYGYYPDWSYFDHPPLSGWLNAAVLQLSDSDFALRLWPVLLAALSSILLFGFSRELFPAESAWLATLSVVIYQLSIISQLFGIAMLPDTPLIPVAIAAAWLLYRSLNNNQPHLWIYVGILFGLAGLAKYTAVTLVITAVSGLVIFKRYDHLATKWPWLAILLASLVISPVLYWNIHHDWISITYQLEHGAPDKSWQLKNFFVSQLSQFIAYSPGIFIFGLLAVISSLGHASKNEKYLLAFSLPVLLLFALSSGNEQTLPHWTALGWIALSPLIAKWLIHHWTSTRVKIIAIFSLLYSLIIIVALHVLLASPLLPFETNKHPLADLYGWNQVAQQAMKLQKIMQQENNTPPTVIFVGNWSQFSRLAWYARPTPVQVTDQRYGQSDLWYGSAQKGSSGVLVVPAKYQGTKESGVDKFDFCKKQQDVHIRINNKVATTYQLYKCYGYKE